MKKKSIPLKTVNGFFLFFIGILCMVLSYAAIKLGIQFKNYASISDQYAKVSKAALTLQDASDFLTEESRLYVVTGEFSHLQNYFNEVNLIKRREQAVEDIQSCNSDENSVNFLKQALQESIKLEEIEYYSMKLVVAAKHIEETDFFSVPEEIVNLRLSTRDMELSDQDKIAKAWLILFSKEYMTQKNYILNLKSQAITEIFKYSKDAHDESLEDLQHTFIRMMMNIAGIFALNLFFFICIIFLVLKPLYNHIRHIQSGKKLGKTRTHEFNILTKTYNEMYERNEANEVLLRHKAEHDELTGVMNRAAYNQVINALSDVEQNIALILIDVDFFKLINDNYGHTTGDKVLQRVAQALTDSFRTSDYVCRIGGDEFTVVMTNCDADDEETISLISDKMNKLKSLLKEEKKGIPSVSLSCGIDISHTGYNASVYEHADLALYEVKRSGRDDFSIYQTLPEEKRTASNIEEFHE